MVIDSIAFHFRYDHGDMGVRARLLNGMAQVLIKLAHKHQLAVRRSQQRVGPRSRVRQPPRACRCLGLCAGPQVVLMNQMTTKLRGHEGAALADHAHLVPALGKRPVTYPPHIQQPLCVRPMHSLAWTVRDGGNGDRRRLVGPRMHHPCDLVVAVGCTVRIP